MIATRWFASILSFGLCVITVAAQQPGRDNDAERELRHQTDEWRALAPHLPDPATATAAQLSTVGDVLRARRLPEDALEFYGYALKRGGDEAKLQNSIGITLLELQRIPEARMAFRRAIQLKPKSAEPWNNLGATEYSSGSFREALRDYGRAVKLDKKSAVFHSNLGTAYFELKDYESARSEYIKAIKLDPQVFRSGSLSGIEAHIMSARDRGRFCFEMAKMAARSHDDDNVVRWLARSSEMGFDVKGEMWQDKDFIPYRKDVRVLTLIQNARAMRTGQIADSGLQPPDVTP
jgi:tetratricopeptide (TPR) repeat protein